MTPYPYSIRESPRAKRASLRATLRDGLVVVLPRGGDPAEIPRLLHRYRRWIERTMRRMERDRKVLLPETLDAKPEEIILRGLDRSWEVRYLSAPKEPLTLTELPGNLIELRGNLRATLKMREKLQEWLRQHARRFLAEELEAASAATGYSYAGLHVGKQKSAWGICSQSKRISLNRNLLFFPPELLRLVIVHELCHTRRMDHSPDFWALVAAHVPDLQTRRKELRTAWRYVPEWAK